MKPKVPKEKIDPFEKFFKDVSDVWQFRSSDTGSKLPMIHAP